MPKGPKLKAVNYRLLRRDEEPALYDLLDSVVHAHHQELQFASIALAWATAWKPDVDGHEKLGQMKKASDLDRELAPYDLVILLNRAFWQHEDVTTAQRTALIDHELCHATVKLDADYERVVDERGRQVYRLRKHDLEEFAEIVERHGLYKRDLEAFAQALSRASDAQPALALEPVS